ncbi:MAG: hypothetical protein IPM25_02725 [Chloracidobacterium sp.]|nr:hypothetical protein [Chloracidobacterium sp.]
MIEGLPGYISPLFIATTFLTVATFFYAVRTSGSEKGPANAALFLITFWLVFVMSLSLTGFYLETDSTPPRLFFLGIVPSLLVIAAYFTFFRESFIAHLPLETLTLIHVIRVPVEIVLFWLYQEGLIPKVMTFEGRNFDILAGLTVPIIYFFAFHTHFNPRFLLIGWNLAALGLLANIVTTAALSIPSPIQQMSFDQPNRAILYFPFIWLPAIVVPIVMFSHFASLYKLFRQSKPARASN